MQVSGSRPVAVRPLKATAAPAAAAAANSATEAPKPRAQLAWLFTPAKG